MTDNQKSVVEGIVDNITFQNTENGYTVCTIDSKGEIITLVGNIPMLTEGEYIKAHGVWTNHATYGKQFSVETFEKELPATASAILSYLSSGVIKGIGPVTAKRICDKYGEDTLKVIEEHPEWLSEIKGISPKKIKEISESFKQQYGMRQVMLYFQGLLTPALSLKVYKMWGNASVDILRNNPYLLCEQIDGISFEKADEIATKTGTPLDSEERLCAGVKSVLTGEMFKNGNCCLPLSELCEKSCRLLSSDKETIEYIIGSLSQNGDVVAVKNSLGIIHIYLKMAYDTEKYIAEKLLFLDEAAINIPIENPDEEIAKVEAEKKIQFAPLQKIAIKNSVTRGVVIVTGGPGTGKTTVIRAIIALFERLGSKFCLAAPTGRAAKRMTAATGFEAKTIHRLLECEYQDGDGVTFRRNEDHFLDEKVIIIDEASMVDMFLFASLLKAVRPGSHLIIIGDADQLSPVGPGEVFSDIIKSEAFMAIRLCDIFRQESSSSIVTNAHLINQGKMPICDNKDDFFFMSRNTSDEVSSLVSSLCFERLPKAYSFDSLQDIQIICPTRKGKAGTVSLNVILQNLFNPRKVSKKERNFLNVTFREGDKVMMIKNNYDIEWTDKNGTEGSGVFNGDIGFIKEIDAYSECFSIEFDDGKLCVFDFSCFEEIEHAYAITVHKSQGSEYPCVIVPLIDIPPGLVSRNMLYTALTRAGKIAVFVGKGEVVADMVRNARKVHRYTGLCRILGLIKQKNENNKNI